MKKDEYLEKAISLISNKRAKQEVKAELSSHLDDLTDFYLGRGCTAAEAEERAVADMGDSEKVSQEMGILHKSSGIIVTVLKFLLKLIAIVLVSVISLYILLQIIGSVVLHINSKSISKHFAQKDIKIDKNDYEHYSWADLFGCDEIGFLLSDGWSMKYPNSRVKDNDFCEEYLMYNDNTDVLFVTYDAVLLKDGFSFPSTPLLEEVKSIKVNKNNSISGDNRVYELNLTRNQAYGFLEILVDESKAIPLQEITGVQYVYNSKHELDFWDFIFEYDDLPDIRMEGICYIFSDQYFFAKDINDNFYVVNKSEAKMLPKDIAEEIASLF